MDYFLSETKLNWLMREENIRFLSQQYQQGQPFPHIVLDDLFDPYLLDMIASRFPSPDCKWWKYDNVLEKKHAKDDLRDVHPWTRFLINELMEKRFVYFLEALTGIENLICDHSLNGGGLHQIVRGGKLDVHADYNYHPKTKLDRRLNVLIYLNSIWRAEWKGHLELWNKDVSQCVKSIEPSFNRMVIFSITDTAYHGHPDPLECPDDVTRKSIAIYYYTNGRPEHERSAPHSTVFKRRPQDPIIEEHELLRQQRAVRRIGSQSI